MQLFLLFALFLYLSPAPEAQKLVQAARDQIGITITYYPCYVTLDYPGGDLPISKGVCSDVIIRAFRKLSIDLQKDVHEDIKSHFDKYPKKWGLQAPDKNIDHRRVPNLMIYFQRKGFSLPMSSKANDYKPGDIVSWDLGSGITHIGIVSDRTSSIGVPLIIHNIGSGAQEEDILFSFKIIGHYRCFKENDKVNRNRK